jgi:two-component system chemotaxis response regulator CheY
MALNILVVDDSATMRALIIKTLEIAAISIGEIHQAGDGQEGLDLLADNWIDLIFLDINMPVMSGVEMVDKMAEDGLMKTIPVIIVSTEGSKEHILYLKEKGIRAYLRKPFKPEQLRETVEKLIGKQEAE